MLKPHLKKGFGNDGGDIRPNFGKLISFPYCSMTTRDTCVDILSVPRVMEMLSVDCHTAGLNLVQEGADYCRSLGNPIKLFPITVNS